MGETISKSAGKVYQGDVVDYCSATDELWHIAEIIEVNSSRNGLTVLCRDTSEVAFIDFSRPEEKKRVARVGTHSGHVGIEQARRRQTRTVATTAREAPPRTVKSIPNHADKSQPEPSVVPQLDQESPHAKRKLESSSQSQIQIRPQHAQKVVQPSLSAPSPEQGKLMRRWKADSLVDVFSSHELLCPG